MEESRIKEALEDMVYQFAYDSVKDGVPVLHSGGLSALEYAFEALGWSDPYPIPEQKCQIEGCSYRATCGIPTNNGYKRVCGEHYEEVKDGQE